MWKNRILYVLLLAVMFLFYVDHSGWVSWYALLITLCMPMFSLLLSLPAVLGKEIKVYTRGYCHRGEESVITVALRTGIISYAPLCKLDIIIHDLMAGTHRTENVTFSQRSAYKIPLGTEHSGIYECEIVKARAYDLLGLFSFRVRLPKVSKLAVLPRAKCPEPRPDFSDFRATSFRPKPGGGFSEIHEMREYRAGDPLRTIHWKLSAKTDKLIVREAQEPEKRRVQVSLALTEDRSRMDAILDELKWVSEELLRLEIGHNVLVINSVEPDLQSAAINTNADLQALLYNIMSKPLGVALPENKYRKSQQAEWRYHIEPHRKGEGYEKD